jgi:hypothetical protein
MRRKRRSFMRRIQEFRSSGVQEFRSSGVQDLFWACMVVTHSRSRYLPGILGPQLRFVRILQLL